MACPGSEPRFSCWDGTWASAARQYSLREILSEIKQAGYDGAELGSSLAFLGESEGLRALLTELDLALATLVVPTLAPDARQRVDYAAHFGVTVLMVGGGTRPKNRPVEKRDMEPYARALGELAGYAAQYGMELAQHTHPGAITGTTEEALMLLDMVPDSVGVTADTAHLQQAGSDPVAAIGRFGDRLKHLHLKDYRAATDELLELGRGEVDLAGVMAACQRIGYRGWYSVELDRSSTTPLESARVSRQFLLQMGY